MEAVVKGLVDDPLLVRCAARGYTPAAKDVPALLSLWARAGQHGGAARGVRKPIVAALGRGGSGVAVALLDDWDAATGPARAMRLRALTKIAQRVPVDGLAARLRTALEDPEPRVVREAARAVGKHEAAHGPSWQPMLLSIARDAALPERRAAVEALGRVGDRGVADALGQLPPSADPDLQRRIAEARTMILRRSGRRARSAVRLDASLPTTTTVVLRCRRGVGPVLLEEMAAIDGMPRPELDGPPALADTAQLRWHGRLAELYAIRSALDVGLCWPLAAPGSPAGPSLAARIVATLTAQPCVQALRAWTDGTIRFRLSIAGKGSQRAVVWAVARALRDADSPLINDSRDVVWAVEVDPERGRVVCRPKQADPRFAYRHADVPAASHPTLAAMLAWVAAPRAGEVVWDPFCGSASELIECARRQPGLHLLGCDRAAQAIAAAQTNFAAAGIDPASRRLWQGDALADDPHLVVGGVALIITNPPMGHRVGGDGRVPALLESLVARAARLLAPGGRMVWLSPLPDATAAQARRHQLTVEDRAAVDMGGFSATLQILTRPQ